MVINILIRIYGAREMDTRSGTGAPLDPPIRAVFVGMHKLLPAQDAALKQLNIDPPPIKPPPSASQIRKIYSKFLEILNLLLSLFK
jgi:hypothetical protein